MSAMLSKLCDMLDARMEDLLSELRSVYERHGSVEYTFSIQALPSVAALPPELRLTVVDHCRQAFSTARDEHLVAYPGVPETLCELYESGIVLIATTNAPLRPAIRRLERLEVDTWFAGIAARRNFAGPANSSQKVKDPTHSSGFASISHQWEFAPSDLKPSDCMYRRALLATDTQPADALVVGDSLVNDLMPALSLGARGAWARYGLRIDTGLWETLLAVTPWPATAVAEWTRSAPTDAVAGLDSFRDILALV